MENKRAAMSQADRDLRNANAKRTMENKRAVMLQADGDVESAKAKTRMENKRAAMSQADRDLRNANAKRTMENKKAVMLQADGDVENAKIDNVLLLQSMESLRIGNKLFILTRNAFPIFSLMELEATLASA